MDHETVEGATIKEMLQNTMIEKGGRSKVRVNALSLVHSARIASTFVNTRGGAAAAAVIIIVSHSLVGVLTTTSNGQ